MYVADRQTYTNKAIVQKNQDSPRPFDQFNSSTNKQINKLPIFIQFLRKYINNGYMLTYLMFFLTTTDEGLKREGELRA